MTRRIRIKDIASQAGVSPGTVDRVLHKRGNVSAKSRAKVMDALDAMDYSPNVLASVLAYNKNWKIAVLLPREEKDPFWKQPKEGLIRALKAVKDYGVSLDFFQFYENDVKDFEAKSSEILKGDYNAVILSPVFKDPSIRFMQSCDALNIPFIQINTYLDTSLENQLSYIGQDSYHSGVLAAKLLAFGLQECDKVLIVHLEELVYDSQHLIDKEKGFKDYYSQHSEKNVEVITGHFVNPYHEKGLHQFFKKKLNEHPEIRGVFVTTSRAFHVVKVLEGLDRLDLKLVGYDLIEDNLEYLDKESISFLINQNPYKQGYLALITAFNFLVRKIDPVQLQHLPLDVVMKENVTYYTDAKIEEIPIVF